MKSWASANPPAVLSFDLGSADLARSGFYFCSACHRVTELLDPDDGVSVQRCAHCRSHRVEWRAPVAESVIAVARALPPLPEVPSPRAMGLGKRLLADQRDLRVLARTGYWFCYGCKQIALKEGPACSLCGSEKIEWNEPVWPESEGDERDVQRRAGSQAEGGR